MSVVPFKQPKNTERTLESRKLKMALRNTMLIDGNYTPAGRCVGMFIIDHWNERKGYAYPPIDYMVAQLKLSDRVVRSAVEQFRNETCAYFIVKKTGRNYIYYFKPKTPAESAAINTGKKCKKHRQKTTGIPAESAAHPYKNPNTINLGKKIEPKTALPRDATTWDAVKVRLASRLGQDVFTSWFEGLVLVDNVAPVATLLAPTKFISSWIASHYEGLLEEAWRCEDSAISRVVVIDRGALPVTPEADRHGSSAKGSAA